MKSTLLFVTGSLLGLMGCHQEPALVGYDPPAACRISLVEHIREGGSISRQGYQYDAFGSLTQYYEENQSGQRRLTQTYVYDPDHYVISREDKTPTGTVTYTYTYDAAQGRISRIAPAQTGNGPTLDYDWEGSQLKSLTTKAPNGSVTELLTFQPNGLLATRTRPNTTERFMVDPATGYLTSYTQANGVQETFTVNDRGNHLTKTYREPAISKLTSSTYVYAPTGFFDTTQLRFRGIPDVQDGSGKPGLPTEYTLTQSQNGQALLTQRVTFRYTYNAERYALGYDTSTGERGKFYYTNCSAEKP